MTTFLVMSVVGPVLIVVGFIVGERMADLIDECDLHPDDPLYDSLGNIAAVVLMACAFVLFCGVLMSLHWIALAGVTWFLWHVGRVVVLAVRRASTPEPAP